MTPYSLKVRKFLENLLLRARFWLRRKSREPFYKKCYFLGLLSAGLCLLTFYADIRLGKEGSFVIWNYVSILTCIFFSIGFLSRAYPIAQNVHSAKWAKVPIIVFHALAILFGAIPARNLISASSGLPPEDFDIAVGIITLGFYPLAWLFLSAVVLLFLYVFGMIVAGVLSIFVQLLMVPQTIIAIFSKTLAKKFAKWPAKIHSVSVLLLLHVGGAIGILFLVVTVSQAFVDFSLKPNPYVVGLMYFTDYHENTRYPVVRKGEKSKVHANGIVSYATIDGSGELKIKIDNVRSTTAHIDKKILITNINPFRGLLNWWRGIFIRFKQVIEGPYNPS